MRVQDHLETISFIEQQGRKDAELGMLSFHFGHLFLSISDRWNPAIRKRMLSDSGLGKMSPHYEVPEKQKEASQMPKLQ